MKHQGRCTYPPHALPISAVLTVLAVLSLPFATSFALLSALQNTFCATSLVPNRRPLPPILIPHPTTYSKLSLAGQLLLLLLLLLLPFTTSHRHHDAHSSIRRGPQFAPLCCSASTPTIITSLFVSRQTILLFALTLPRPSALTHTPAHLPIPISHPSLPRALIHSFRYHGGEDDFV